MSTTTDKPYENTQADIVRMEYESRELEYREMNQMLVDCLIRIRNSAGERLLTTTDPLAMEVRIETGLVMGLLNHKGFKPTVDND